jgi:hypothetical protein
MLRQVVGHGPSTPFADVMLAHGSRLHVVIPQITRRHMGLPVVGPGSYVETLSPGMAGHWFSLPGTRVGAQIVRICVAWSARPSRSDLRHKADIACRAAATLSPSDPARPEVSPPTSAVPPK